MTGIKFTLVLTLVVATFRAALFWAGVDVKPMSPVPVHLFAIILIAYFSGHFLLNRDPSRQFGELLRAGFQDVVVYAILIAIFTWIFYTFLDTTAFSTYNERLVEGFVAEGYDEIEAREKVGKLYNATSYAAITFFGCFLAGTASSFAFAILHHKVLRRFR